MKFLKSLIDYSGIALIYLQFSVLFDLHIHFIIKIIVFIFIAYSFVQIINADKSGKKMRLPIVLTTAAIPIVILFDIQRWPGIEVVVLISCSIFLTSYLIRFLFKRKKRLMDYVKVSVLTLFILMLVFSMLSWPFSRQVGYLSLGTSLIGYFLYMFTKEQVIITHERLLPRTTLNIEEIKASDIVGCYECGVILNSADDVMYDGATAICPNCERSSLIGSLNYNVTKGSLASLKKEFDQQNF